MPPVQLSKTSIPQTRASQEIVQIMLEMDWL